MRRNVDTVYFIEVWLAVVNYITKMISVAKDVLTWIDKHLHLIGYQNLESYQKDVFLLVKNHGYIPKFETLVFVSLERNSVELIFCTCLIIVDPNFLVL
jgi:hypothetical protein